MPGRFLGRLPSDLLSHSPWDGPQVTPSPHLAAGGRHFVTISCLLCGPPFWIPVPEKNLSNRFMGICSRHMYSNSWLSRLCLKAKSILNSKPDHGYYSVALFFCIYLPGIVVMFSYSKGLDLIYCRLGSQKNNCLFSGGLCRILWLERILEWASDPAIQGHERWCIGLRHFLLGSSSLRNWFPPPSLPPSRLWPDWCNNVRCSI